MQDNANALATAVAVKKFFVSGPEDEVEQTSGDSGGWGSLAHRSPWGRKESDTT